MRRLGRHVITVCSALSLAACAAAWVRGRTVVDRLVLESSPITFRAVALRQGAIYYLRTEVRYEDAVNAPGTVDMPRLEGPPGYQAVGVYRTRIGALMPHENEFLGFDRDSWEIASGQVATEGYVPLWPVALASCIWFAFLIREWASRAEHRRRSGLCPACGYDLRASPERCPECGVAPQGASSISSPDFYWRRG